MSTVKPSDKIKTIDELTKIIAELKEQGKKVVLCHGVFDLLHPGHFKHFAAARREGDLLVVTLTEDRYVGKGPGRPVFNQRLRAETLAEIETIDYVAINKWPTAVETLKNLQPDVYAKGSDYADRAQDLTGEIQKEEQAVKSSGGRIHFTDEVSFSSTELLNVYFNVYNDEADHFLKEFRKEYSADRIIEMMKDLKKLKVLVIGDTIIDEYHYCEPLGKAWKETVITARYINQESFAGGVLATANHIAGFCDQVDLITLLGQENTQEEYIRSKLKPNITPNFFYRDDAPTITKRRYVDPAFLSKMFEICFFNAQNPPAEITTKVCKHLAEVCSQYDLVLVSDFGNGFIGKEIVETLCENSRFLSVNAQTNSANTGFNLITKYPRADYICIDEPEIRLALSDKYGSLKEMILQLAEQMNCQRVTVTRGHNGSLGYQLQGGFYEVPVLSKEVVDRIGAGDAYLAVTSACVAAGYPMDMIGFVGNAVGALAVRIVCNRESVEPIPLYKFITALLK